jgi:hypothetical protein
LVFQDGILPGKLDFFGIEFNILLQQQQCILLRFKSKALGVKLKTIHFSNPILDGLSFKITAKEMGS